ncbi:MAG: hypothetical protein AB7U20_20875 [Planctomycetaceae bacterium]
MRVLVYKRTHNGDPDAGGRFGIYDCMGTIRDREFDAVIGVGGMGATAKRNGIAGLVNWIGIGDHRTTERCKKGWNATIIRFDHFKDCSGDNLKFTTLAPKLARKMYQGRIRHLIVDDSYPAGLLAEVKAILDLARRSPPSRGLALRSRRPQTCSKRRKAFSAQLETHFCDE